MSIDDDYFELKEWIEEHGSARQVKQLSAISDAWAAEEQENMQLRSVKDLVRALMEIYNERSVPYQRSH